MSTSVTSSSWYVAPSTTTTSTTSSTNNNLSDFDSFVQLLATELQYQDPTDPVSSTEYVSQMAQMSSLQQLQTIGAGIDAYTAYSMIGKTATYETTDSSGATTTGTGTVQSVTTKNSKTYLNIGGTQVELAAVVGVSDATTA